MQPPFLRHVRCCAITVTAWLLACPATATPPKEVERQISQAQDHSPGAWQERLDLMSQVLENNRPASLQAPVSAQALSATEQQNSAARGSGAANLGAEGLQDALYEVLQHNDPQVIRLHDGKRLYIATQAQYAPLKSFALLGWDGNNTLYANGFVMPSCALGREGMQPAIERVSRQLPIPAPLSAPPEVVQQRQREEAAARQAMLTPARNPSTAQPARQRAPRCDETRMRVSLFYPKGRVGLEELTVELAQAVVAVIQVQQASLLKPERQTKVFDIDLREFR